MHLALHLRQHRQLSSYPLILEDQLRFQQLQLLLFEYLQSVWIQALLATPEALVVLIAALPLSNRAIGTLNGEQET